MDLEEGLSIFDRGRNFESIANDRLILLEGEEFGFGVGGNFLWIEVVEGEAEGVAFI